MRPDPPAISPKGDTGFGAGRVQGHLTRAIAFAGSRARAFALVVTVLALSCLHVLAIPIERPRADGAQYLAYAYNLLKYQTYSWNRTERPQPDQRREPVYPIVLGAAILLHPGLDLDRDDAPCVSEGAGDCVVPVTWLLAANVVILALAALLVFHATDRLTGRAWLAWIGLLWVFSSAAYGLWARKFFPEALAGLLMLLLSLALWRLVASGASRRACLATGVLLGVLVLTKASFYYFLPPLAAGLGLVLWKVQRLGGREAALRAACVAAGTLVLTLPWQIRNEVQVGTFSLAGRAGLVLADRANINDITGDHYLAALAYYAPPQSVLGRHLRRHLSAEFSKWYSGPDGPQARAYRRHAELSQSLSERRGALKRALAEDMLGDEALARMLADPIAHLRAIPLVAFRGMMSERGFGFIGLQGSDDDDPVIGMMLGEHLGIADLGKLRVDWAFVPSLALFLPALVAFPWCLAKRRWDLVFLMAPAAFLFVFQAMFSQFLVRYSAALYPTLMVIALLCASAVLDRIARLRAPAARGTSGGVR